MKRPRVCVRLVIALVLFLVLPLLWGLVLAIAPTGWARSRIVHRLTEATGRPIHLGRLRMGVLGGVHLADLSIGAPRRGDDPWLKLASARINLSVLQLLAGQLDPSEVELRGVDLRILRRRDGTLELADLLRPEPSGAVREGDSEECPGPSALEVRLRDSHVALIDEPSSTTFELEGVEGHAIWQGRHATIHELRGTLNGGPFELAASLDRTGAEPAFECRFRASGVSLDQKAEILSYFLPVLSGTTDGDRLAGRLDATLYLRGRGTSRTMLRRTLLGQGTVSLDGVGLEGSRFLAELAAQVDLPDEARVGSLKTAFVIKNGRIGSENLTLNVAKVPIVLSGWTDFDGRLEYRVGTEGLTGRLSGRAREILADLAIDVEDLPGLRISGTLDAVNASVEGGAAGPLSRDAPARRAQERPNYRDLGRRLRDRVLR